jgi:hypothetical protein
MISNFADKNLCIFKTVIDTNMKQLENLGISEVFTRNTDCNTVIRKVKWHPQCIRHSILGLDQQNTFLGLNPWDSYLWGYLNDPTHPPPMLYPPSMLKGISKATANVKKYTNHPKKILTALYFCIC